MAASAPWLGEGAIAGMLGGAVYGLYEAFALRPRGMGRWGHMNAIGATLPWYRPVQDDFRWGPSGTGIVLHAMTSAIGGAAYGTLLGTYDPAHARSLGREALTGLGWGAAFWATWGLLIGPSLDPAMLKTMARDRNFFLGHLIYGTITGLVLASLLRRRARGASRDRREPAGVKVTAVRVQAQRT
ncbi:hypothetical protein J7643_04050 [bacterium]|nr:hypothetical protein [bacterium]